MSFRIALFAAVINTIQSWLFNFSVLFYYRPIEDHIRVSVLHDYSENRLSWLPVPVRWSLRLFTMSLYTLFTVPLFTMTIKCLHLQVTLDIFICIVLANSSHLPTPRDVQSSPMPEGRTAIFVINLINSYSPFLLTAYW